MSESILQKMHKYSRVIWRAYGKNAKLRIGLSIFLMLVAFSLLSLFSPLDTRRWYAVPRELPPSIDYLLGTTSMGRDVFWELSRSVHNSLLIAFITALISTNLGLAIGLFSGLKGGVIDRVLTFLTDTFVVIPGLPLLIVITSIIKSWITTPLLGLLIAIVSWAWPTRQIRSIVLSLRERTFVCTAVLSGMSTSKIILREIMPFIIGWYMVLFTNTILFSIGYESGLAILGLSVLGENTLGVMIYWAVNQYYAVFRGLWWWFIPPLLTLILLFISLYLISSGLSELLKSFRTS
jgi:peptide/nickel transport system permease protein